MGKGSRFTMQDCDVEILIPSLTSFAGASASSSRAQTPNQSVSAVTARLDSASAPNTENENDHLDRVVLQAYESGARDLTDVFVGESVLVLVVVRGPEETHVQRVISDYNDIKVSADVLISDAHADGVDLAGAESVFTHTQSNEATALTPTGTTFAAADDAMLIRAVSSHDDETVSSMTNPAKFRQQRGLSLSPKMSQEEAQRSDAESPQTHYEMPIQQESGWIRISDPLHRDVNSTALAKAFASKITICKGIWIIVNYPAQQNDRRSLMAQIEKQRLTVVLRESSTTCFAVDLRIGYALEHTRKLSSAASSTLIACKQISVRMPVEISCQNRTLAADACRTLVSFTVRNITSDVVVVVAPPVLQLPSTQIVNESDHRSSSARTTGSPVRCDTALSSSATFFQNAARKLSNPAPNVVNQLGLMDSLFACTRLDSAEGDLNSAATCDGVVDKSNIRKSNFLRPSYSETTSPCKLETSLCQSKADECTLENDVILGLQRDASHQFPRNDVTTTCVTPTADCRSSFYISEFNELGIFVHGVKPQLADTVTLKPGEVYNFLFVISPSHRLAGLLSASGSSTACVPRLESGQCFETGTDIAWFCQSRCLSLQNMDFRERSESIQNQNSKFPEDRTFPIGKLAFQKLSFRWSSPELLEIVFMTFSGPAVVDLGSRVYVDIIVRNQTRHCLNQPRIFFQPATYMEAGTTAVAEDPERTPLDADASSEIYDFSNSQLLLPMRPVIPLASIAAGSSACVRTACVAASRGVLSLGEVMLIDASPPPGVVPRAWRASKVFEVLVVGAGSSTLDEPIIPSVEARKDATIRMIDQDLTVVDLKC